MAEVGQRFAACERFRWMPGMRDGTSDAICVSVIEGEPWMWFVDNDTLTSHEGDECWPDTKDPPTIGCIEHLVREAWPGHTVTTIVDDGGAMVVIETDGFVGYVFEHECSDIGEALVLALEKAPK